MEEAHLPVSQVHLHLVKFVIFFVFLSIVQIFAFLFVLKINFIRKGKRERNNRKLTIKFKELLIRRLLNCKTL